MIRNAIASTGLVLFLAACSSEDSTPENPPNNQGTTGGSGVSASTGGSTATGGGTATGGSAGGGTSSGTGGTATGGSGGSVSPGGGGSPGTGGGGSPGAGTGGDAAGGSGGVPSAGMGGEGAGQGGMGAAGADTGQAGGGTGGTSTDVTVQLASTRQEMMGFGINNNWAPAMSDAEADQMFDPDKGIGLSILRIGMASSGEPFNGSSCWQDIQKAQARGVTTFIGTLWTPPANCKTNNNENDGGHLMDTCYESFANTIAAFPAKVKQGAGVDLYAMSPQNEVDFASCGTSEPCNGNYPTTVFTGAEMAALVKVVGPKLHALNPPVRVMAPEASEWLHIWSNESACCSEPGGKESSDPLNCGFPPDNPACDNFNGYDYGHALYADQDAWAQVDILGVHQYDTQVAEPWPADVPDKLPIWQTEMSGVKWWPEQGPSSDISNGVAVAGWIHNALTVGDVSAWLWWWWKALGNTNEGLLLSNGTDTKRHYTLGNYSKFVRPGYTRVDVTGEVPADVLLTAFTGPDGTVVVVAINKGSAAAQVPITIAGGTAPASLVPWVTSASDNLASKDAVMVSGGTFTASLPATTVTTFVGK